MQWDNIAIMIFFVYIFLQRVGSLPNTANSSARTSGKIMINRSFSGLPPVREAAEGDKIMIQTPHWTSGRNKLSESTRM